MGKIGIVFPGQGSQTVGMLKDLAAYYPQIRAIFTAGSEVGGYDMWELAQRGPKEKLNRTEYTQPILLVANVAVWRVWQELNQAEPAFMAGHSLGEYAALVGAEALSLAAAIRLVQERASFMQAAYRGRGAMVAIVGLESKLLEYICHEVAPHGRLMVANYNSGEQTVVAGELRAAERAIILAKKAGARLAKLLPVSIPAHCPLMEPAAAQLATRLAQVELKPPRIRVIHNADVAYYEDPAQIRAALVRQLYSPVRWVETIEFMFNNGVHSMWECGPGRVLTGLTRRISPQIMTYTLGVEGAWANNYGRFSKQTVG